MIETIKTLFWASRPISWINTAYPFAVAYFLTTGTIDTTLIIGTLFFLIPYNLLMYGIRKNRVPTMRVASIEPVVKK